MRHKRRTGEYETEVVEVIVASGYLEAHGPDEVGKVVAQMLNRHIEVPETKDERIVFLIERETAGEVKQELDTLKDIEGVRGVYLAYYSLDGGDEATRGTED